MKFSKVTRTHQLERRCKVFSFFPTLLGKGDKGLSAPLPVRPKYGPCDETEIVDLRDRAEFPPRLFLGHSAKHWALWMLGAITAAIWLGPLLAELTNRFLVKLW